MAVQVAVEDKRAHVRHRAVAARCVIEGEQYQLLDLSMGGFSIGDYRGQMITKQKFRFHFEVPVNGKATRVPAFGIVAWVRGSAMGAMFVRPRGDVYKVLADYIAAL